MRLCVNFLIRDTHPQCILLATEVLKSYGCFLLCISRFSSQGRALPWPPNLTMHVSMSSDFMELMLVFEYTCHNATPGLNTSAVQIGSAYMSFQLHGLFINAVLCCSCMLRYLLNRY